MGGIALATLFLGLCLIDAKRDDCDINMLASTRVLVFFTALIFVAFGI
jgi:hypothetical protein